MPNVSPLFNATDADVVLRTSDNVCLRVYRVILMEASPFFRDLFSLPQGREESDLTPTIGVSESAKVMEGLLRLIYPGKEPTLDSLEEISTLLVAAAKYDATRAVDTLRRLLVQPQFLEKEPNRVYAIATRHNLELEASIASSHTLRLNLLDCPLSDDLRHISAYSYHRLLVLHRRRGDAAIAVLENAENESLLYSKCPQCSAAHYNANVAPRWWEDFKGRAAERLRRHPTTECIFSLEFLAPSATLGCQRCAESILNSQEFLWGLKQRIDDLPSSV